MDWLPSHCDTEGNETDDQLAKSALIRGKTLEYLPTPTEIHHVFKQSIRQEWSQEWRDFHGFGHCSKDIVTRIVYTYNNGKYFCINILCLGNSRTRGCQTRFVFTKLLLFFFFFFFFSLFLFNLFLFNDLIIKC